MDVGEVPTGVGWTGLMTAYSRAQESLRNDRMFMDPLAAAVVSAANIVAPRGDMGFPRNRGGILYAASDWMAAIFSYSI
ncbi:hypothetical protein, partial [Mycobacterium sp. 1245111.1]|uniref:hypothetical protein n=1 Tax=Mycobacterium sp. 1245111.1 TaxID=1834073 RepID=UPI000A8F8DCE